MTGETPKAQQASLEQAFQLLQKGPAEDAVKAFSAALSAFPGSAAAHRGRATAYFQLKKWNSAVEDFKRAKELQPDEPESWLGLGMGLAMQLEIYPALNVLEDMLLRWPSFVRGHIQLALLQIKLGAVTKGKNLLQHALTLHPVAEERRIIESTLNEQSKLDQRRHYRPDFDALRKGIS